MRQYGVFLRCSTILTALTMVGATSAVLAQTSSASPATEEPTPITEQPLASADYGADDEDLIVVTGSRIRRENETSAIPLQVLGVGDIDASGTVDIAEVLTELPGVSSDLSPENTGLSTQNSGLSTISLRRLGGNRTLTLIDGRRAVSNSGNGERVNLVTLPAGFVKRTEVTTGGASAIYGSDAIAGVVNLILEDDFEGLRANFRYNQPEASGEEQYTFDITYGSRFSDGRGYFLVGFTYDNEAAIYADETRPASLANVEFNRPAGVPSAGQTADPDAFGSEIGFGDCDASGRFCINPSGSSNLPGGLFEGDDAWNIGGVWFNDQSLLPQDGRTSGQAFETDVDGYNFRPGRSLSPSLERYVGGVRGSFEVTPDVEIFAEVFYSRLKNLSRNAALNVTNGTDIGVNNALGDVGSIAASHPFIPPEVEETRSGTVSWRRRFVEVGTRDRLNIRETWRSAFGLNGSLWESWRWEAYGTYGRFEQNQTYINELDYLRIRNALRIESNGAGGYQCTNADARAEGCVPLNIFGEGSITDEAADYIRYTGRLRQTRVQGAAGGSMNGDLFDLPAGPVKAAFGIEYRYEGQNTIADGDADQELTSVTPVPAIEANFSVIEGFVEFDVPIVADKLSLQLAGRVARYSTIGTIFSFNVGGSYEPVQGLRVRGQYSRSQRAPTLTEYFSPPRGDFDDLRDPCDGLMRDGSGVTPAPGSDADAAVISANCLAEPGIQAFFANPENAGEPFEYDGSVSGPNAGNTNLHEETADTYTTGIVLTPSIIPNMSLIVDYYNIRVRGAIGAISTQLTADLCYGDSNFPNNRFCDVITRDSSTGNVIQVINRGENLNSLRAQGVDVSMRYNWEFNGAIPGRFEFDIRYSRYIADNFTFLSISGPETEDTLGLIGNSRDEFRARFGWNFKGFRVTWTTLFESGGVDDLDVAPTEDAYFRVGNQDYHNLYMAYTLRGNTNIRFYMGVNNIFDDLGPLIPTGLDNGNTRNITNGLNDLDGREFYGGIRVQF